MCSHLVLHSPRNTYLLGWLIHKYMRWIRFAVNGKAQDSDLHLGRRRVSRTDVICNCDITGSAKSNLIPSATDVVALLCNICKALITRCLARSERMSDSLVSRFGRLLVLQQLAAYLRGVAKLPNIISAANSVTNFMLTSTE